jgi:Tol biopolymer transport system component
VSIRRLVQLLFAVFALGLVSSAGATPPGHNGRIVFSATRNGESELYSINFDGSAERRLTWTSSGEGDPSWSPDGTKIAYASAGSGSRSRIWVMNADGSGQMQLATPSIESADDIQPQWSPDGTQIAFASTRVDTWNVWVINADGTSLRRVTDFLSNDPAWSPDGRQLAYVGANAIGIVDADGTNAHWITGPGGWAGAPSWSPDGRLIVFNRNDDRGYPGELYVVNADGSNETKLTSGGFNNAHPSWSPDGTHIAFQRAEPAPNGWHLWTMAADGSNALQLTTAAEEGGPDWGTSQVVPEPSPPDAPTIQIDSPTDGGLYFPGTHAIAFYSCSSYVSYVITCEGDIPFGQELDLTTAGEHTFTVRAVDLEGRTATKTVSYEVLDLEPPQIDLRTPSDGATYDLGADLTVDYSCSDPGGSGVAQCTGDLPNGSRLNTDYAGTRTFHVFALDNAGRLSQVTATYTIADRGPPRVVIQSPLDGHDYSLGASWLVNYYCWSSGNVRIVSCDGPVPNGGDLDTADIGPHSFAVTATDANGKTTTVSVPYRVIYLFHGFDPPVDTGSNLDGVRAGDSVALKFSLDGDHGLGVVTKTTWQPATCGDWIPTGPASPVDGRLSYSASTDRYREIVASSSSWRGSCRLLRFDLDDGTHPEVRVHFKK